MEEILFEQKGSVGLITLNRPKALNALNLNMIRLMDDQLTAWADNDSIDCVVIQGAGDKAFCAGGDVKAVYYDGLAHKNEDGKGELIRDFFYEEYQLNRKIFHYPKPYIALLDGIVMGGGVGLSFHGSRRIVTEKTTFAMPETGIGLFPDVGVSYFLSRMPNGIGLYLGLTGARLKAIDCLDVEYATHYLPSDKLSFFVDALVDGGDIDQVLDQMKEPCPGESRIDKDKIYKYFKSGDLLFLFNRLHESEDDWEQSVFESLNRMSPTSLGVTMEQLKRAAHMKFDDIMVMDYRLSQACMHGHDFYEGIRAVLVEKDHAPKWKPSTVHDLNEQVIKAYFKPLDEDLTF